MKKNYLLIAAGLLCAVTMQAQRRVVASLGFEDDDPKYTTTYSLTALEERPSWWGEDNANVNGKDVGFIHGDWVNCKNTDQWTEKYDINPHSGEFCFQAMNHGSKLNPWDRGFKIGLEDVKEETPYRVSFWVKVDPTDENNETTVLTSWFSQGVEELDKSIPNYGIDQSKELISGKTLEYTGDWQRIVYQVFVCKKSVIDATHASWQGNNIFPWGDGTQSYWNYFGEQFPDMYFFIANMFSPATYYLDDILVEENVTVKEVTHSEEIIKIDFGYATNIAALANANGGTISLDPASVSVLQDGEPVSVSFVEGKSDGFLYVFVDDELYDDSEVLVNFVGDSRVLYTATQRPTAETGDVAVLGFEDEPAYWDPEVYAVALAYGKPTLKRSVPVDQSFNLNSEDVNEISLTFASKVSLKGAKAILVGSSKKDVTSDMQLSDDKLTITVPVSGLADGPYDFIIENLMNEDETETTEEIKISFEIGEAEGDGATKLVYESNWEGVASEGIPFGYSGFTDGKADEVFSSAASPASGSGSAPRLMGNTNDKFNGIYWSGRNGAKASLAFGKLAAQTADGETLPDNITAEEALWFEEGDYVIEYQMLEWQRDFTEYTFSVYNGEGEAIVSEKETPKEKIEGVNDENVSKITTVSHEVHIDVPGYYYIEFEQPNAGWQAWLLKYMKVSSKPSSAGAYYSQLLQKAIDDATATINSAPEGYNGASKTALTEVIENAQNGHYTSAEEVKAVIDEIGKADAAMAAVVASINSFPNNLQSASDKYNGLEGKYKNSDIAKKVEALIASYGNVEPLSLSDEELNNVAAAVKNLPAQLDNVKKAVDLITYRADKASLLALTFGVDDDVLDALDELGTDNVRVIDDANAKTTVALYEYLGEGGTISEDMKNTTVSSEVDPNFDETDPDQQATHDEYGHYKTVLGVDFTGYIKNPNFYTFRQNFSGVDNDAFPGWTFEPYVISDDGDGNVTTGRANLSNGWSNTTATDENPVVTAALNAFYGDAEYKFYQEIKNLPVGKYNFVLGTRTGFNDYTPEGGELVHEVFNAQNEETGEWDKYIFVQIGDTEPIVVPFSVGSANFEGIETIVPDVVIDQEGQTVTFGVVEHYVSGKGTKNGAPTNGWNSNTYVKNAKLYFLDPLENYDYKAALNTLKENIETAIETVEEAPAKQGGALFNLAGQQVDENYKGIVVTEDGKKFIQQ